MPEIGRLLSVERTCLVRKLHPQPLPVGARTHYASVTFLVVMEMVGSTSILSPRARREAATKSLPRQVAALPYRCADDVLNLLLVTSRETRRWIVPKGWSIKGLAPHEAAAREAMEEAGVLGTIAAAPIGFFIYDKRLKTGVSLTCRVDVFPLMVEQQLDKWPEQHQRERRWATPAEAMRLVCNLELQKIFRDARRGLMK